MCCKTNQTRAAPKRRHVTRVRSTRCCCEHTHVCCRMIKLSMSPKGQRLQRFGRPPAAVGRHLCVAPRGLQRSGRPNATEGRHMCGAEQTNSRLHPRSKVSRFGRPIVALSTHMSSQGCAHGSRVTRFGRPRAAARTHIVRAHVPCRIDETRAARIKGYQGLAEQLLM